MEGNVRSDYIPEGEMQHLLAALMPANRLACEVSLATGLRIGDVLSLRPDDIKPRPTITESKTGKSRRIYLNADLQKRLRQMAGRYWVFESRCDEHRHRSRQAVYVDLKRAAKLFRLPAALVVTPHSCRKIYAVGAYKRSGGKIAAVQRLLQHSHESVTMLYAMADALTQRKLDGGRPARSRSADKGPGVA